MKNDLFGLEFESAQLPIRTVTGDLAGCVILLHQAKALAQATTRR